MPKVNGEKYANTATTIKPSTPRLIRVRTEPLAMPFLNTYAKTKAALIEMHHIRMDLINEMSSADPDTAKMFAMADDIGRLHAQIKRSSVEHFLVLKSKTSPEQFERFIRLFQRSIMDDNFGRWSRRQGQGQGPYRRSKGKRSDRNN